MSQAGKGHVPEENLPEYRRYAQIARQYDTLSNTLWNLRSGYKVEALEAVNMRDHFWEKANALRVDLPTK